MGERVKATTEPPAVIARWERGPRTEAWNALWRRIIDEALREISSARPTQGAGVRQRSRESESPRDPASDRCGRDAAL